MDKDKLVSVYTTRDEGRAEVIRAALENEGIHASIDSPHQGGLAGTLEVNVYVRDVDETDARKFISEHEQHAP